MPDWNKIVREHLAALTLPHAAKEDVSAELASHLEETYEQALARGLNEAAALHLVYRQVADWQVLAADISRAKSQEDPMNHRTKALWLPGMATLFGASMLLMLLQYGGFQPHLVWVGKIGMLFYWPWLAGLPLFGAIGAYLSRRAQGPIRARLVAAMFPALVMLITMCLILPYGLAISGVSFLQMVHFGLALANWVALPSIALFLGTLPFLNEPQPGAGNRGSVAA